ncbi:DsbA family protein [Corynebacterium aurimucosum]|uniref:DsbA family protein n=1 Tax=Corynebacterium aurimucosum TaxID=169292 RepID=UPI0039903CFE
MSTVKDPNSKSNSGFVWGLAVLLVIIAVVIGYIVYQGRGAKTDELKDYPVEPVSMEMSFADNAVTLKAPDAPKDATEVDLYEDFSCPHCGDLAKETDGQMKDAIDAGELIVHVRTLNFLDGSPNGLESIKSNTGHSSKTAAAMEQVAKSGDATLYWNLRKYLMENQSKVANQWEMKDFADAAQILGADEATVKAIKEAKVGEGNPVVTSNYEKLEKETGSVSSPRIIKDGKDIPEDDKTSIMEWVNIVTEK